MDVINNWCHVFDAGLAHLDAGLINLFWYTLVYSAVYVLSLPSVVLISLFLSFINIAPQLIKATPQYQMDWQQYKS